MPGDWPDSMKHGEKTINVIWTNPNPPADLEDMTDEELEAVFRKVPRPVLVDYMTTAEHLDRWFGIKVEGKHNE
jgi:hypothetical protein